MLRALIQKELRALGRDWHALAALFLMPAVFIIVMSLALQGSFRADGGGPLRWQVLDEDNSDGSRALIDGFGQPPPARVATRSAADKALKSRALDAVVIIERGLVPVTVLADPGAPLVLVERLRAQWERAVAGAMIAQQLGLDAQALQRSHVRTQFVAREVLTSVQQSVPAWLVFAMFFVVVPLSNVLIAERNLGTLERLRSLGVPAAALLAGKVVPFFLVHQLQLASMLLVGRFVVPALGGDALQLDVAPAPLLLIAGATSVAALGVSLLIAGLARTSDQAILAGAFVNIIFGAVGGIMVPKHVMPPAMQQATNLSPMAWGLEGFLDVFARRGTVIDVLPEAAALTAIGLITLALAAWRIAHAQ